jgi:hypothetical protein
LNTLVAAIVAETRTRVVVILGFVSFMDDIVTTIVVTPAFGLTSTARYPAAVFAAEVLAGAEIVTAPPAVPLTATNVPPVTDAVVDSPAYVGKTTERVPDARRTAVCVVPVPDLPSKPTEPTLASPVIVVPAERPATPFVELATMFDSSRCATGAVALADGIATTESSPAPSADTATSAMRLRSVFVDMFFLSLVEFGNFPISARRSFNLLIPLHLRHTRVVSQKNRKPIY